jgi:hypothetical protein
MRPDPRSTAGEPFDHERHRSPQPSVLIQVALQKLLQPPGKSGNV